MQNNNKQYQNELLSRMNFLQLQIEEIESLPDKSLFFQNPLIFEGWVSLIRALDKIEPFYVQEREQTTETYVLYLLSLRELKIKYKNLAENYYYQLKDLLKCYAGWLIGECISKEGMVALSTDQYEHDMDNVEDLYQYLVSLNDNSNRARSAIYTVLTDVFNVLLVIMNRGGKIIRERFPNLNDFVKAINDDLRLYTKDFGEYMLKEMNEDLNRHYKDCRTDPNTPALWGDMLTAYEQALKMAIKKELAKCDEPKQEHWDSHQPKDFLDDNSEMISRIYELCYTDKLIDFSDPENIQPFLNVLTSENIELFYNLIVMRNLIQCEMYPNLKAQHEAWLRGDKYSEVKRETTLEAGIRRSLERLMQERIMVKKRGKELEEPLFKLQNHWQGVYRILVDKKYSIDADFEGFNTLICKAMPKVVNKPYSKESVKQISKKDFNIPFEKWKYNAETSGKRKVYDRMYEVAKRFKEILEEEGL